MSRSLGAWSRGGALAAAFAALGLFLAGGASASAEPSAIPIVAMSEAGPDKELPTSGAFYLSGKVGKEVSAVYPVFVRVSYPPLGIGGDASCSVAQKSLSAGQLIKVKDTPVIEATTGVLAIDRLWEPPGAALGEPIKSEYERLNRWHDAYVPPAWVRPAGQAGAEEASYQVLVSEPRYFRPGATYCLLVYERRTIAEQEKLRVPKLLREHRRERAACEAKGAKEGEGPRCGALADTKLIEGMNALLSDAGRARAKDVLFKVRTKLVNAAAAMSSFSSEMKEALDPKRWSPPFKAGESAWGPPRDFLDVDLDPLGRLFAELLASKGHIYRSVHAAKSSGDVVDGKKIDCAKDGEACAGRVLYTTRSGSIQVRYVRVRSGLDAFEVASDRSPSPAERDEIAVHAGSLPIYGTGITLEDALELARGRVKIGARYVAFGDLYSTVILPALAGHDAAFEETGQVGEPSEIKDLGARIEALRGAVSLACAGAQRVGVPPEKGRGGAAAKRALATDRMVFEPAVQALTGLFLEGAALSSCGPYAGAALDPLETISGLIEGYLDAARTWRENESAMTLQITKISTELPKRTPITVKSRVTQETFFDNYVTPYLGRAALFSPREDIGMTYAGIQLFLWPNDVAEPMWTNGPTDLHRLVGLELGAGLSSDDFGEGNRFSGLGPLPPLFVGGAIHGIPYITLSLGAALMERRRSGLTAETRDPYASFYIGVTAQLNAIGIVRNLTSGRGASKAEEK